jgi:hypothetical protein
VLKILVRYQKSFDIIMLTPIIRQSNEGGNCEITVKVRLRLQLQSPTALHEPAKLLERRYALIIGHQLGSFEIMVIFKLLENGYR